MKYCFRILLSLSSVQILNLHKKNKILDDTTALRIENKRTNYDDNFTTYEMVFFWENFREKENSLLLSRIAGTFEIIFSGHNCIQH
ncbi:hypothetical protein DERP_008933 [Dermatophagoides pteronyssinus]|uniref:Uncharacterized protein n=1 Tax=Dermatophagoides pteronyssinus TaxID=6956 RepID=A0ABQ8JNA2_DERPT|nr:hypothetical protein DERP_008933 [Dermatophagoides pteronyssinus]